MFVDIDGTIYFTRESGGPGSGNWGHLGIPGYHGGSQAGSGGIHARPENYKEKKGITEKKTQSKTDKYIDAKTEFGATPALESKLNAAFGDNNWDETEIDPIKNAINNNENDIILSPDVATDNRGGSTGGIFGGDIISESDKYIELKGVSYSSGRIEKNKTIWKIPKESTIKNYKGEVVKILKTQKL